MLPELRKIIDEVLTVKLDHVISQRDLVVRFWDSGMSAPKYDKQQGWKKWTLKNFLDRLGLPIEAPKVSERQVILDKIFQPQIDAIKADWRTAIECFESNLNLTEFALKKGVSRRKIQHMLEKNGLPTKIRNKDDYDQYWEKTFIARILEGKVIRKAEVCATRPINGVGPEDFYKPRRIFSGQDKVLSC